MSQQRIPIPSIPVPSVRVPPVPSIPVPSVRVPPVPSIPVPPVRIPPVPVPPVRVPPVPVPPIRVPSVPSIPAPSVRVPLVSPPPIRIPPHIPPAPVPPVRVPPVRVPSPRISSPRVPPVHVPSPRVPSPRVPSPRIPSPRLEEKVTTEPPIHAIYARTGPRKILMLLKPRSREVVYAPYGIDYLRLDRQRLPPYELATNIVARGGAQLVSLPYLKGRPEEEIERMILAQQPQPEYQITDILPGNIYTGEYGKLEPVGQALRTVTPCQRTQYLSLAQSPRGSPFYDRMIVVARSFDALGPGSILLGKNGDYIVSSTLGFKYIIEDIRKCGRVYYLIGVSRHKTGQTIAAEETAHAMAIVVDPQLNLLEVFDPNGINPDTRHVYFWSTQLVEYLKQNGIQVQRRITADEPFCPQGVSAFAPEFRGNNNV